MLHRNELLQCLGESQYLKQSGFTVEIGRYKEILIDTRSDLLPNRFIFHAWHRLSREQFISTVSRVKSARRADASQLAPQADMIEGALQKVSSLAGDLHACIFASYPGRNARASHLSDHVQDLVVFGEWPNELPFGFRTIVESGTTVMNLFRDDRAFYESYYVYGTSPLDEMALVSRSPV